MLAHALVDACRRKVAGPAGAVLAAREATLAEHSEGDRKAGWALHCTWHRPALE